MGTKKSSNRYSRSMRNRRISVRTVQRQEPDVRKLAKAVISLAMAQVEADAQAEREAQAVIPPTEQPESPHAE